MTQILLHGKSKACPFHERAGGGHGDVSDVLLLVTHRIVIGVRTIMTLLIGLLQLPHPIHSD